MKDTAFQTYEVLSFHHMQHGANLQTGGAMRPDKLSAFKKDTNDRIIRHALKGMVSTMKKALKVTAIVLVVLLAAGAGLVYVGRILRQNARERLISSAQRYTVARGDLSLTAVGSGKIVSSDVETLIPTGSIRELKVQVGDSVKKGDVLATILTAMGAEENFITDYAGVVTAVPVSSSAKTSSSLTSASYSSGFEISDPDHLQMDIQATEQDVYKIKTGQKASVYIEAPGLTVNGTVSRISLSGDTSGDFTTYDVTVKFDKTSSDIYLGMTGSAKITVESKSNVLKVPVDAIIEQNGKRYVLSSTWLDHVNQPQSDYYIPVTTGLSDADNVEITSALSTKQILILSSTSSSDTLRIGGRNSAS